MDFANFSDKKDRDDNADSSIRNELGASKDELKQLTGLTDSIFHDSFNLINRLSNEYFFIETDAKSRENILKEVGLTIKKCLRPIN